MNATIKSVTIPAGTLIHVAGIPFRLLGDTAVEGTAQNLALALSELEVSRDQGDRCGSANA